jgi:hypothetical protein
VNSWFVDFGHGIPGGRRDFTFAVRGVHRRGGLSMINHPSISMHNNSKPLDEAYSCENDYLVNKIQRNFEQYSSLIGMEVNMSNDRKLWDILLENLAPKGRNVFGLNNTDTHNLGSAVNAFSWHMMPANNAANVRTSLETGAFFGGHSSIRCAVEIARWTETLDDPDFFGGNSSWRVQRNAYNRPVSPKPMVSRIAVNGNSITVQGNAHVRGIQWIADGEVVYRTAGTSSTIDLAALIDDIGSYVRAELIGPGGVLFTQPFLLSYESMPAANPVPSNFFDFGRVLGLLRMVFLWPLSRIIDEFYGWVF